MGQKEEVVGECQDSAVSASTSKEDKVNDEHRIGGCIGNTKRIDVISA
jgi:hypothetical protein